MAPFLFNPHPMIRPMIPLFPVLLRILHRNYNFACLACILTNSIIFRTILPTIANFGMKFVSSSTEWPPSFGSPYKKTHLFAAPLNDIIFFLFFSLKSYTKCPYFHTPVRTSKSLSYLSTPRDLHHQTGIKIAVHAQKLNQIQGKLLYIWDFLYLTI